MFKPGDIVVRTGPSRNWIVKGQSYTVDSCRKDVVMLKENTSYSFLTNQFTLKEPLSPMAPVKITMEGKYQTRDGRSVRVLCVDAKPPTLPVLVLIAEGDGREYSGARRLDGTTPGNFAPYNDLVPVPVVTEEWHFFLKAGCNNPAPSITKAKTKEELLQKKSSIRAYSYITHLLHITYHDGVPVTSEIVIL